MAKEVGGFGFGDVHGAGSSLGGNLGESVAASHSGGGGNGGGQPDANTGTGVITPVKPVAPNHTFANSNYSGDKVTPAIEGHMAGGAKGFDLETPNYALGSQGRPLMENPEEGSFRKSSEQLNETGMPTTRDVDAANELRAEAGEPKYTGRRTDPLLEQPKENPDELARK